MTNHELAMDALIDLEEEKGKLEKEIARLENEIKRCSGMLKNPGFVNKAPEAKVNAEKEKLASYQFLPCFFDERLDIVPGQG